MFSRTLFTLVFSLVASGCLSDLRPAPLVESGITESSAIAGRAILNRAGEVHGGVDAYHAKGSAKIQLTDLWPSWLTRTAAMPWPENGQPMELVWKIGTDTSRLTFTSGPEKGHQWGIQNWKTYTMEPSGEPVFEEDREVLFWLPTVQYFSEAPFRLVEAPVVSQLKSATVDGVTYDLVFLTWNSDEPQSDVDQYIAWFEHDSGKLGFIQYTIRDMMGFLVGCMKYEDYRLVDGFWVAHKMTTMDHPGGQPNMHIFEIQSAKIGADVPNEVLYPRPELKGSK